jgi:protein CpxP
MKRAGLSLAAVAVVLLVGAGCHRGPRSIDPERARRMVHSHVEDFLDDLDATPAQRQKASELEATWVTQGLSLHNSSKTSRAELVSQLKSPTPDKAKVHALIDERIEAYRAFAHQLADGTLEFQGTLSAEQRAIVEKKLDRFAKHSR